MLLGIFHFRADAHCGICLGLASLSGRCQPQKPCTYCILRSTYYTRYSYLQHHTALFLWCSHFSEVTRNQTQNVKTLMLFVKFSTLLKFESGEERLRLSWYRIHKTMIISNREHLGGKYLRISGKNGGNTIIMPSDSTSLQYCSTQYNSSSSAISTPVSPGPRSIRVCMHSRLRYSFQAFRRSSLAVPSCATK